MLLMRTFDFMEENSYDANKQKEVDAEYDVDGDGVNHLPKARFGTS